MNTNTKPVTAERAVSTSECMFITAATKKRKRQNKVTQEHNRQRQPKQPPPHVKKTIASWYLRKGNLLHR